MTYEIIINPSGVRFKSKNNLLKDALEQSIALEHSCQTGECGVCEAELISGQVENENGVIVTSGKVLTCCSKAMSDSVLKANYLPELTEIKSKKLPCKVESIAFAVKGIAVIKLRLPPTAKFAYLPGQYVDLAFNGVKRSYSIANSMSSYQGIELHVRSVPEGAMSALIFNNLKLNQLMRIDGPKGTFFVRKDVKPLIFLAGGSGFAPVKAIVEELMENEDDRKIFIYWGVSDPELFYFNVSKEWANLSEHITFVPVVSGDSCSWGGRFGFVHQAVLEDFDTLNDYQVYASGSPVMVDLAKQSFVEQGLLKKNFFSDSFTASK